MSSANIQGVLVSYGFGIIAASKRDDTITTEVLTDKNAGEDAGVWSNKLFPKKICGSKNVFTDLRRHLGQMRSWHHDNTFAFEEKVWRILPEKRIEAYKQQIEVDGKERANELLEKFIEGLPALIDLARIGRGEAFNESDYPSIEEIRKKFYYDVSYRPIPVGDGLNPELFQNAIAELNILHQRRLAESNQELISRLMEPLRLLGVQMADPENRKMGPVLERIREVASLVPSLELSGNTELLTMAHQLGETFKDLTPDAIKKDAQLAELIGRTSTDALEALQRFGAAGLTARSFA